MPPMSPGGEPHPGSPLHGEVGASAARRICTKLREDAFIDIKPGYVDTAASPNETKPVYTTATNEHAKSKLKKKEKVLGCSKSRGALVERLFFGRFHPGLSTPFHNFDLIRTASQQPLGDSVIESNFRSVAFSLSRKGSFCSVQFRDPRNEGGADADVAQQARHPACGRQTLPAETSAHMSGDGVRFEGTWR